MLGTCGPRNPARRTCGRAVIAGYTVLHGRGQTPKGIALVDVAGDRRAMVTTDDGTLVAQI